MLRDVLRAALAAQIEAKIALDHAAEAQRRAVALVEHREQEVDSFADLDEQITAHTIESLREDGGLFRSACPDARFRPRARSSRDR